MNVVAAAVCAVFLTVLGTRVCLTEARWPDHRVHRHQRRVVRGLDVLAVVLVLVLVAALATVIGPFLLTR